MQPVRNLPVAILVLALGLLPAGPAAPQGQRSGDADAAGLHRCTGPDGAAIFTDRRCQDMLATEDAPRPAPPIPQATVLRVRTCARDQDDLLFGVRSALEDRDVNRLADFYHWVGMDTAQGYRMLDRLDAFSAHPLLEVQLVASAGADLAPEAQPEPEPEPAFDPEAADGDAPPPPPARRPRPADLLRVDQLRSDSDMAQLVTYFHLRSNAGCWWLQF